MKRSLAYLGMCNETNGTFGECSRAKKSKTSSIQCTSLPDWSHLPDVVIYEIFQNLNYTDRKNASSVCKHWRQNLYHPKWWQQVTFKIDPCNIEQIKYFTSAFAKICTECTIQVNTLTSECVDEFISLLQTLCDNTHLKSLMLEPTHCRFEYQLNKVKESSGEDSHIIKYIKSSLSNLNAFSIGCIEDLSQNIVDFLSILSLRGSAINLLGLATVKDDPGEYKHFPLPSSLIKPFRNLEILSMDYDDLTDDCLADLAELSLLRRLIVHLHGIKKDHSGTTNGAWKNFKAAHPSCELRLTVIHAFKDVHRLHLDVLRKEMPLSHLKVFFCENVNLAVLECLSNYYVDTLKSLLWVDSLTESCWAIATPSYDTPDPFLFIAWLCKYLEEIVLYGYKYWEENLIAIARLRGDRLKKLEIAEDDILFYNESKGFPPQENCLKDIPLNMKQPWAPISRDDLHPVLRNPTAGDSDEYLLPIVLADLH